MNDLIQLEMTLDEARETDRLIKRHINTTRYLLLDMRDRKGWKALGYESFKEYGEKALGYKEAYVYRLVDAAEIALQLGYDSTIVESQPKESHLQPLKAVPEEERKAIWDEATRKAEEENAKLTAKRVEDAVEEWKQRNDEWKDQWKAERDKASQLQTELDIAKAVLDEVTKPERVEVIPEDYQTAKTRLATLEKELTVLQKEQAKLVNDQVKAKLRERQTELDEMERRKTIMEEQVERMKTYMASLESDIKRAEVHQKVIEEQRLHLISLAAFISDMDSMKDRDTIKRWLALADMHMEAANSIRLVFGETKPRLAAA